MKKIYILAATIVLLAALPLAAQNVIDVTDDASPVKEITVTNQGFNFIPAEIRARQGDTLRLTFRNDGGFHDWTVDEFEASTRQIPAGDSDTIEFVVDRAGTFEYYCSVGNHRQQGMVGSLVVEE